MRTPSIEQALEPGNLDRAWRALASDKAHWLPGLPRKDMEDQRLRHQLQVLEALRTGRYRPEQMRQFTIPKANGGQRVLSALCLRDKFLQRAVLQVLEPWGEQLFHPDSYGYRPRRSVDMALRTTCERIRCGFGWLVDADIRAFFDEIPHGPLLSAFDDLVKDKPLRRLMRQWLECFASTRSLFGGARGIPQGAVVSPFLCNLYLNALDGALQRQRLPFVRYADDFLVFAPDERTARRAYEFTDRQLKKLGMQLHPEKTQVVRAGPDVTFLGHRLVRPPVVTP